MRDARRIQDRAEVRIERVQVVWLTLGVVVMLGVVFALGVLAGRRAARLEPADPAGDPIAQLDADGELHRELTFYDRLTSPAEAARPRSAPDPAARPSPRPPTDAPGPDEVPAADPAGLAAAPPGPVPEGATRPDTSAAPPGAEDSGGAPPAQGPAQPSGDATVTDDGDDARVGLRRGPARAGEYTVQVSSFQTREEAQAYAAALERKGYRPFVVVGEVRGRGTWYRVRIGSFRDEHSATGAKTLLAAADIPAWVLRTE